MISNYSYDKGCMSRFGSFEKFNRVLYGGHADDDRQERFFTFAGDTPIFMGASSDYTKNTWCYQAKQGILMSGLALTENYSLMGSHDKYSSWFHDSSDIIAAWHHGYMSYDLTRFSSYFPDVKVHIEVYPLNPWNGYAVHYEITTDQRVIFCAGFGGITSFFGRFEYHTSRRKEFSSEDCGENVVSLSPVGASVSGPNQVTMRIAADFDCEYELDAPGAMEEPYPAGFLAKHSGTERVVKLKKILSAGAAFSGKIIVLQNESDEVLRNLIADKELCRKLRGKIREKYASVSFNTPDPVLNSSVPDTMIALDAAFHGNSFYHGAVGYHAPFLGWRGWYAPAFLGWGERVRLAVESHFDTITHVSGQEKVWWDGGDRPDLDHEGTQYHHLENSSGHLTALLHRDDIYDMQEVALDMTLYYLEHTSDDSTLARIFDRILEILDWEERILDPDGDGLYQNFLNTWISDGHSYNGAGCAQASAYNYAANLRAAGLGRRIGRDVGKLERRAEKIRLAMQEKLWLNEPGVMAESVDTIGNKMVHPSPELSTAYLAIDCGTVDAKQAWRMLKWTERNIKSVKTAGRGGKLYFSSNWLPKKYSTCGIFPAENACLALAYYQNGQPEKAFEIVNGLADAFALSPHPGSITHVLSAHGGTDGGDIDFTDVSSCYLRLLVEGLWGIKFDFGKIRIAPQIPDEWQQADISLPDISLNLSRQAYADTLLVNTGEKSAAVVRLPMRFAVIDQVLVNGQETAYTIVVGFGRSYVEVTGISGVRNELKIYYQDVPFPTLASAESIVLPGSMAVIEAENGIIEDISGIEVVEKTDRQWLVKIGEEAREAFDCFVTVGNTILSLTFRIAEIRKKIDKFSPGEQRFVDLSTLCNASLTEIHQQEFRSPRPKGYSIGMRLNGRYAWEWNHYGHNALHVDDSILRGCGGTFSVLSGWNFAVKTDGENAMTVSLWDNFPTASEVPLSGTARTLAVLFCGTTNAMQSYVPNAKFEVIYADNSKESVPLIQPENFDDFLHPVYQKNNEAVYFGEGTHGLVQLIRLDPEKELKSFRVEALAGEVIVNVIALTLDSDKFT